MAAMTREETEALIQEVLEVYPEKVTALELEPASTFTSVRTYELLMDSYDRERRGLAFTATRPARRMPNKATGYWSRLGIMRATLSPAESPAGPRSQAPKAADSSEHSA